MILSKALQYGIPTILALALVQFLAFIYFTFGGFFSSSGGGSGGGGGSGDSGAPGPAHQSAKYERYWEILPWGFEHEEKTLIDVDPMYDRVIFMVIDALRSDFVNGNTTQFKCLNKLIEEKKGIGFVTRTSSPTVTLPRLKSLVSGSISNFLDVINNFHPSSHGQSSWLSLYKESILSKETGLRKRNKDEDQFILFGDDTWLKIYPTLFDQSDGVSSFFVTDYTTVDYNVTRHLNSDLFFNSKWRLIVLHYLGVDHVGHCFTPSHPLMQKKHLEMDHIIDLIYQEIRKLKEDRILFVICGDHGMTDGGNHGGSSYLETTPAAIFISNQDTGFKLRTEWKEVPQVCIAPTMSCLLGVPVPFENHGYLIPELFEGLDKRSLLKMYYNNAIQIYLSLPKLTSNWLVHPFDPPKSSIPENEKDSDKIEIFSQYLFLALNYHKQLLDQQSFDNAELVALTIHYYQTYLKASYNYKSSQIGSFGYEQMYWGLFFMTLNVLVVLTIVSILLLDRKEKNLKYDIAPFVFILLMVVWAGIIFYFDLSPVGQGIAKPICSFLLWIVPLQLLVLLNIPFSFQSQKWSFTKDQGMVFFVIVSYMISLFSTSYIEEEYAFWYYWIATLSLFIYATKKTSAQLLMIPILIRGLSRWNYVGFLFAGEKDIKWTLLNEHSWTLDWMIPLSLIGLSVIGLVWNKSKSLLWNIFFALEWIGLLIFKYATFFGISNVNLLVQLLYTLLVVHLVFCALASIFFTKTNAFLHQSVIVFSVLFLLLQKSYHALHLLSYWMIFITLYKVIPKDQNALYSMYYFLVMRASYCLLGGSNLIADLDMSHSTLGLTTFHFEAMGMLLFLYTWQGPILFACFGSFLFTDTQRSHVVYFMVCLVSLWQLTLVISDLVFLDHLFIWSVFSPRHLYELFWSFYYLLFMLYLK